MASPDDKDKLNDNEATPPSTLTPEIEVQDFGATTSTMDSPNDTNGPKEASDLTSPTPKIEAPNLETNAAPMEDLKSSNAGLRNSADLNALKAIPTVTLSAPGYALVSVDTDINNLHTADTVVRRAVETVPNFGGITEEAKIYTAKEANMPAHQAIRLWRAGCAWSVMFASSLVMVGYDMALIQSFYAQNLFTRKFGANVAGSSEGGMEYEIPAGWKCGLTNAAVVGEIIGLSISGHVSEKYGHQKTMVVALGLMIGSVFIPFFAPNKEVLLVGQFVCGIPWGVFQTLPSAYATDVVPQNLRAHLCTLGNLCFVLGQLIASGVTRGALSIENEWAYRLPFALQWVWPILLLRAMLLAPPSPWWLVRKGRLDEARKSILRLTNPSADLSFDPSGPIAMIQHTTALDAQTSTGSSYTSCFKGVDRRRTEISCGTWLVQQLCGSTLMNVSTIFFRSAGIEQTIAFDLTIATYGMGIVGTIKSWFLMAQLGRRTIYLWGVSTLCILLIIMGGLSFGQNVTSKMALAVMLLIFAFIYDATVGPVCYAIVAEVPSQQLKSKTIVIARILYNVGGIFANILTNYQITEQPSGWGWGGKTAFFWAASAFLCVVWVYFRLVEPKGRSYGEMTILFEAGVSAREFGDKTMDIFRGDHVTPAPSRPGSRHPSTLHLPLPDVEKEEKVGSAVAELGSGSSQSSLPV